MYEFRYLLRRNGIVRILLIVAMIWSYVIFVHLFCRRRGTIEDADPPGWGFERATAVVQGRENVVEVVPYCSMLVTKLQYSKHENVLCPTTIPHISSFGTVPCITTLKPRSTQGRYGALNTNNPRKLSMVSGFFRLQM